MSDVLVYVPRATRYTVDFPVEFTVDGGNTIVGMCENLSESGLLASFSAPLDIWTTGRLDIRFGQELLGLRARVARVIDVRAGFAFQALTEEHRAKLRDLVIASESITGSSGRF